jgi:hypothetical protein
MGVTFAISSRIWTKMTLIEEQADSETISTSRRQFTAEFTIKLDQKVSEVLDHNNSLFSETRIKDY